MVEKMVAYWEMKKDELKVEKTEGMKVWKMADKMVDLWVKRKVDPKELMTADE